MLKYGHTDFFYFRVSQSAFKIVFFAASIRLPFICVNIDTLDRFKSYRRTELSIFYGVHYVKIWMMGA